MSSCACEVVDAKMKLGNFSPDEKMELEQMLRGAYRLTGVYYTPNAVPMPMLLCRYCKRRVSYTFKGDAEQAWMNYVQATLAASASMN